jgi:hypothetical protein
MLCPKIGQCPQFSSRPAASQPFHPSCFLDPAYVCKLGKSLNSMGFLSHLFYPWGILLQVAAVIHFIRRRPSIYWLYLIIFLGPLGALVYLFVEAVPDLGLARESFKVFPRRKRINQLVIAIRDNPSAGNYEELGNLYMDDGQLQLARDAFNKAIAARADTLDTYYRRGVCALQLGDAAGALPDLERVVFKDADFDFRRAAGLLAHAYALTGQKDKAEALFRHVTIASTLSETYLNFADLLASEGKNAEARQWAQKVLDKRPTMPGYLRRRERPWFRSASRILKRIPA